MSLIDILVLAFVFALGFGAGRQHKEIEAKQAELMDEGKLFKQLFDSLGRKINHPPRKP